VASISAALDAVVRVRGSADGAISRQHYNLHFNPRAMVHNPPSTFFRPVVG
jgi:hypothetical protein